MAEYIQIIFNKYIGHGCCFGAILKSPQHWAGHKSATLHHSDIYWWNADIHPESETGGRSTSFYSKVPWRFTDIRRQFIICSPALFHKHTCKSTSENSATVFLRWTSFRALLAFQYWKKHNRLPQSKAKKLARLPLHFFSTHHRTVSQMTFRHLGVTNSNMAPFYVPTSIINLISTHLIMLFLICHLISSFHLHIHIKYMYLKSKYTLLVTLC